MAVTESHERQDGLWITPSVSYVEPQRLSCALCGRPIARKYWRAPVDGQNLIFCEPSHAELYESYWIPTHAGDRLEMGTFE